MKITIVQIKVVHTVVFWILSTCVVYTLFSGIAGRIDTWTWVAVGLLLVESVVLAISGWTCPLTILAVRQGAVQGSVSDIFLPRWLADRIFPDLRDGVRHRCHPRPLAPLPVAWVASGSRIDS